MDESTENLEKETETQEQAPLTEVPVVRRIDDVQQELKETKDLEEKLNLTVELMRSALAQKGRPDFKVFWAARQSCLELLKEKISPGLRTFHWGNYRELTDEAKRLKDIFDEESAFTMEQIEIAIKALEEELKGEVVLGEDPFESSLTFRFFQGDLSEYRRLQQELSAFSALGARINALRKEIIATEMRIRFKNKFFQRLSFLGNQVFPKKKALIMEVSDRFMQDVEAFTKKAFSNASLDKQLFALKDEVKALQAFTKVLTLNSKGFSQTHKILGESWDKLSGMIDQKRQAMAEKKEIFEAKAKEIAEVITALSESIEKETASFSEAKKEFERISGVIKKEIFGKQEQKALRDSLSRAYAPVAAKLREEEEKQRQKALENAQLRQQKMEELEKKIEDVKESIENGEIAETPSELATIDFDLNSRDFTDQERETLQRQLSPVKGLLLDAQQKAALERVKTLVGEELQQQAKALKKELVARRKEVKGEFEKFRKAAGSSGLDFEQSMYFNEQLTQEKERLEILTERESALEQLLQKGS